MKIKNALATGSLIIGKRIADISPKANRRLKWFDYYRANGNNARLTCRHFDVSPQTFYRWFKRYNPGNLKTLETRSHRPKHVRQPTYSTALVKAVLRLREAYPRWGKEKLAVVLRRENMPVSVSMVGRILAHLKARVFYVRRY
jgi:transposase